VEQLYQNTFDNLTPTLRDKSNSTVFSTHLNYQPIPSLTFMPMFAVKASHDKTSDINDAATTYLTQLRGLYDLTRDWDVGATGSLFGADNGFGRRFGLGGEVGRRLVNNLRAAAGYNVFGFRDASLFQSDYTLRGPYIRLDYKFDEQLLEMFKSKTP